MDIAWTRERVLGLAPDASAAKSGQDLANPRKWTSFAGDESSIWGLCQGSGKLPYQVIVDLGQPAFKCSCPSRKFPCKHGLGLLLLFAASGELFARAEPPEWVNEWLASRAEKAKKKSEQAEQAPKPVDAETQAKRREKRMERVAAGLGSLRVWVDDLIREGIATAQTKGYAFFDEPARRMIDAQAPGAARYVQELGALASGGGQWHRPFLQKLSLLHLLISAFENIDRLPPGTREEVLASLGIPVSQEQVLATPPINDAWQIIAQEIETEDRLRVQRTWMWGRHTRRVALILQFAHAAAAFESNLAPGTEFDGDLCYFPGSGVRAAIKTQSPLRPLQAIEGFESLDDACDAYSVMLSRQPWLGPVALPLCSVIPSANNDAWRLIDSTGSVMPVKIAPTFAWQAIAVSGGKPVDIVATYDGETLRPLTLFTPSRCFAMTSSDGGQ